MDAILRVASAGNAIDRGQVEGLGHRHHPAERPSALTHSGAAVGQASGPRKGLTKSRAIRCA
ncbi:hypothetical protein SUS17_1061 [Sphingomonas sp. S17]|nr:hypothetical protein SUS17_1061 [Sphingomonas sp. S17]RSU69054.1 hypothetical protein BRX36_01200 [Sphingomonas sp. S-NIH.Pt1_0416]